MPRKPVTLKMREAYPGMAVRTTNNNLHGVVVQVHWDWQNREVIIVDTSSGRWAYSPSSLVRDRQGEEQATSPSGSEARA